MSLCTTFQTQTVKQEGTKAPKFASTTACQKSTANTQSNSKSEAKRKDKNSRDGDRSAIPAQKYFHPYPKSSSIMSNKAKNVGRPSHGYSGVRKAVGPKKARRFHSTSSKNGSYHYGSSLNQDSDSALRTAVPCCSNSNA